MSETEFDRLVALLDSVSGDIVCRVYQQRQTTIEIATAVGMTRSQVSGALMRAFHVVAQAVEHTTPLLLAPSSATAR